MLTTVARGGGCKPLVRSFSSHFQAAREDRDGRSRYRAAKMSLFWDKLGWYRDKARPYAWGGYFLFYGGISNGKKSVWRK